MSKETYKSQIKIVKLIMTILKISLENDHFTLGYIKDELGNICSDKTIQRYLKAFEIMGMLRKEGKTYYPEKDKIINFLLGKYARFYLYKMIQYSLSKTDRKDKELLRIIHRILDRFIYRI